MSEEKKINFKLLNKFLIPLFIFYFIFIIPSTLPNFYPMFTDSGTYAYVACQLNKGKSLYRDVFEIKLPGIYYIYAFIFKIFPDTRWSLYLVDIIITISIFFLIFKILKNFNLENFFWIFSIFFLTSYRVYPSYCDGNLNEHWYLFFYLLFFYSITSTETKFKKLIAGFSLSINFFLKQNFLFLNLLLIFIFRKKIKNIYFLSGFMPLFIFFSFVILKNQPESIEAILIFPLQRSGQEKITFFEKLKNSSLYGPFLQFFILSILSIVKKDKRNYIENFLPYKVIILIITVFALPLFYFHYLIILLAIFVECFVIVAKKYPQYISLILLFILTLFPSKFIKIIINFFKFILIFV